MFHLWQHLILPPSAQSYSQQVVHHRGRLKADDSVIVVLRNSAQDGVTVSLNTHTRYKLQPWQDLKSYIYDLPHRVSYHWLTDEQQQQSFFCVLLWTEQAGRRETWRELLAEKYAANTFHFLNTPSLASTNTLTSLPSTLVGAGLGCSFCWECVLAV